MTNDTQASGPPESTGRGTKSLGSSTPSEAAQPADAASLASRLSGAAGGTGASGAANASKSLDGGVAANATENATKKALAPEGSSGARDAVGRYSGAAAGGAVAGAQTGGLHGAAAGAVQGVATEGVKDVKKDLKQGVEGSKVARAAAVGGAGAAAPQAMAMVAFMAFLNWLKSMFFAMAAMMMNLGNMLWQLALTVLKAVGHAIAAPFVAIGGALGGAISSFFGFGSSVTTPVATAGVVAATIFSLFGGLFGFLGDNHKRDESQDRGSAPCDTSQVALNAGGPIAPNVEAHAQTVYAVMHGWGMPDENIAGILGNWSAESGIDPTSVEGIFDEPYRIGPKKQAAWDADFGHMGYVQYAGIGLGQWTNDRNRMLINYADTNGVNWYDLSTQLSFMVNGDNAGDMAVVKDMIANSKGTPRDAAFYFHDNWERSADTASMAERRATNAEMWYARMSSWDGSSSSVTVPISGPPAASAPGGTTDVAGDVIPASAAPVSIATANIPMRSGWDGFTSSMHTLLRDKPDLVGLQEVHGYGIDKLQSRAPGYSAFKDGSPGNAPGDEHLKSAAVLWKTDSFDLIASGRIIIAEDDHVFFNGHEVVWDRGAVWVQLKRKSDGVIFGFVSAHHMTNPDKYGPDKSARQAMYGEGMDSILHKVSQLAVAGPVFVAGDMNTHVNTPGTWTAASKMQGAGFRWANESVDFIFGPSQSTLQHESTGSMASDHKWLKATYKIGGLSLSSFLDGLPQVVAALTGGGECEGIANAVGNFLGLNNGGLQDAEAQALIQLYNAEGDAFLDAKYGDQGGPGSCGSNHAMNCVSFSTYFMNKYTSFKDYAPGNGVSTADTIASMTGRTTTKTPTAYSVFSHGNTHYGHTGVVLAVKGGDILIGEDAYCAWMGRTRWVPAAEWQGGNWEFVDVTDLVVGGGLTASNA